VVLLLCDKQGDTYILFDSPNARVVTEKRITGTNTPITEHGLFDGLGEGIEFTDTTYTGRYATKEIGIVIDANRNETYELSETVFPFEVKSNESNKNIGIIVDTP